jgi:hypothetical protein
MGEAGVIREIGFVAILGALVAGCTAAPHADPAAVPAQIVDATPVPAPALPLPAAAPQCEAASLQYLIGKPRTEIPVPLEPARRRVYCSSCIVTQDYVPGRTDIVFDSQTGIITGVKCG